MAGDEERREQEGEDNLPAPADEEANAQVEQAPDDTDEEEGVLSPEVLKLLPEDTRRNLIQALSLRMGPQPHPVFQKVDGSHITKALDNASVSEERRIKHDKERRWFALAYAILLAGLFIFIAVFFKSDIGFVKQVLSHIAALIAGGLGGYGVRVYQAQRHR